MLQSFLNGEKTNDAFRVLKHRIRTYQPQLQQDLNLIEKALQKF